MSSKKSDLIAVALFISVLITFLIIQPLSGYWEIINGKLYWFDYYSSFRSYGLKGIFFSLAITSVLIYSGIETYKKVRKDDKERMLKKMTQQVKQLDENFIQMQTKDETNKVSKINKQLGFVEFIEYLPYLWFWFLLFSYIFGARDCVTSSDSIDILNSVSGIQSFFFQGLMYLTVFVFLAFISEDSKTSYGRITISIWFIFLITSISFLIRCHMFPIYN